MLFKEATTEKRSFKMMRIKKSTYHSSKNIQVNGTRLSLLTAL